MIFLGKRPLDLTVARLILRVNVMLVGCCLIMACAHSLKPAPVVDINASQSNRYANASKPAFQQKPTVGQKTVTYAQSNKRPTVYLVKSGDTLFSIAWQYALNHREIVRINRLKNNNIYPGQKLRLIETIDAPIFDANSLIAALNREVLTNPVSLTHYKQIKDSPLAVKQKPPASTKLSPKHQSKPKPQSSSKVALSEKAKSPKRKPSNQLKPINWIWPTNGQVISYFSAQANKGLAIAAKKGQPVRASLMTT